MVEVSVVLASVHIDGLQMRFQHGVLVTSPNAWHVALFGTRPLQLVRERHSVTIETVGADKLSGTARAESASEDGRFLMLAGQGRLDPVGLIDAA